GDVVGRVLVVAVAGKAPPVADARIDARNQLVEGRGGGLVDTGEHHALPFAHRQRRQAYVGDIEAFDALHFRRGLQLSVQAVGPAVVAAAQGFRRQAVALRDGSGAVAADVVEGADRARPAVLVGAPHGDDRQAGAVDHDVVAGAAQARR